MNPAGFGIAEVPIAREEYMGGRAESCEGVKRFRRRRQGIDQDKGVVFGRVHRVAIPPIPAAWNSVDFRPGVHIG